MSIEKQQSAPCNTWDKQTIVVHDCHDERHYGAVTMPLYQNSLFTFPCHEEFYEALDSPLHYHLYSRGNNPSVNELERRLAMLEGGEAARCFASGMAAISASIMSAVKAGDHVICVESVYGPTRQFLSSYLLRFGIETTFVDGASMASIEAAVRPNTTLLFLESPTSMTIRLQDLRACGELAQRIGATTIIDNTWATPIYQNPLALGIDLVVHSLTKYVGGHSDIMGGVIIGSKERLERIGQEEFLLYGGIMTPQTACMAMRGLRTLPLRMERLGQNGRQVAAYLEQLPFVKRVNHPGLPSYPQYELAQRQMSGCGSLFSFEAALPVEQLQAWADRLEFFRIGVSWGGYESLVQVVRPEASDESEPLVLVRLYVGLEDPNLLIGDMSRSFQALEQ
ncbi:PLP-dependent aspartate aminotransferase family protein [Paenibacillus profundus]|uniref:PLP-dependent aspartate aminotransferase family protein n=1 Tax=Paenibacillus profundus TaxID=1173085 RepID=A0ABS8YMY7_9BACL|nr:PLP-dependent aspartate aminotransferase family protein [Paenibacillus profundus]MCE5171970.1 PLP-dependent aspartate aminotransferase family protein [Paenibacillus profundus]